MWVVHTFPVSAEERRFIQKTIDDFERSRIEFAGTQSNVPFARVAIVGAGYYDNAKVHGGGRGASLKYMSQLSIKEQVYPFCWESEMF